MTTSKTEATPPLAAERAAGTAEAPAPHTIAAQFDASRNAIGLLRLVFASMVLVGHSWVATGVGREPHLGDWTLAKIGVAGFFILSGFLVSMSRLRSPSTVRFAWQRLLRIMPGYWANLVVTAFFITPLMLWAAGRPPRVFDWFDKDGPVSFVVKDLDLYTRQSDVHNSVAGLPFPNTVNGSVWTLKWELRCYMLVAVLMIFGLLRKWRWMPAALLVALVIFCDIDIFTHLAKSAGIRPGPALWILTLMQFMVPFVAGMVILRSGHKIPVSYPLAGLSTIAFFWAGAAGGTWRNAIAIPALAYVCFFAAIKLPFRKVGVKRDFSYGVYLYAFPVQQTLAALDWQRFGIGTFILTAGILVVPLAAFSWYVIEEPAMKLKKWKPTRTPWIAKLMRKPVATA